MSVLPCKSWAACAPRVHPSDENDSGSVEVLLPVTLCGSGILAGESGPLGESPPILENAGIERLLGPPLLPFLLLEPRLDHLMGAQHLEDTGRVGLLIGHVPGILQHPSPRSG